MSGIFDEANKATEEMFANDEQLTEDDYVQEPEEPVEEVVEETPPETVETTEEVVEEPIQDNAMIEDAVNTAEIAAKTAQEKDMQLQQALQELEALKAQNQQMQGTLEELSRKNEENLIEEALQPPVLDINGLAFADEETIKQAQAEHHQKSYEYYRQQLMKELEDIKAEVEDEMQLKLNLE